jgi:hypothetical protein
MPGGGRTGPVGMGPMTGRAAGFCAGSSVPGYANPIGGRGFFGRGRGFWWRGGGRGWRNWFYATGLPGWVRAGYAFGFPEAPTTEQEKQSLKQQAKYLSDSLDALNKRIEELEKEKVE